MVILNALTPAPEPLDRQDWVFHTCGPDHIAVAMHVHGGYLYWTRMALSDLPNDRVGLDDLESVIVNPCDVGTIQKLELLRTTAHA